MRDTQVKGIKLLGAFILGAVVSTAFYASLELASPEHRIKSACIDDGGRPQVVFDIPEEGMRKDSIYGTIECHFLDL